MSSILEGRPALKKEVDKIAEASAARVMEIFRELHEKEGKTIVMVTHSQEIASMAQAIHRLP